MDKSKIAEAINVLGRFCGRRDINELTKEELLRKFNIEQADLVVLFGGAIIYGGDVLAEAMKNKIGKRYMISGGAGHTTPTLREIIHNACPQIETTDKTEAECFAEYIQHKYGFPPDMLEKESTNCGNNVSYCLDMLKKNGIEAKSIIVMQDSTMQQRMDAVFRKLCPPDVKIINFGVFKTDVVYENGEYKYTDNIPGMWTIERYISLLMGEIPRLTDDENGYGPNGKGFTAHVDIPKEVSDAFELLKHDYSELVRVANPAFASK